VQPPNHGKQIFEAKSYHQTPSTLRVASNTKVNTAINHLKTISRLAERQRGRERSLDRLTQDRFLRSTGSLYFSTPELQVKRERNVRTMTTEDVQEEFLTSRMSHWIPAAAITFGGRNSDAGGMKVAEQEDRRNRAGKRIIHHVSCIRFYVRYSTLCCICTLFWNLILIRYSLRFNKSYVFRDSVSLRSFFALLAQNCVRCIAFTKRFQRARGVHSKVENFWHQFH
jgi:hypothetical protein